MVVVFRKLDAVDRRTKLTVKLALVVCSASRVLGVFIVLFIII
jgi:hypothetical protein